MDHQRSIDLMKTMFSGFVDDHVDLPMYFSSEELSREGDLWLFPPWTEVDPCL